MNEFIIETFSDLCQKYDMKVHLKTKRTFQLFVMEDIPYEEKEVIRQKVIKIADEMGRSKYIIDNPYIINIGDKNVITSGIWDIRIL
jgi:hypothetical protein